MVYGCLLFFICNYIYEITLFPSDTIKYSRVKHKIDSAFAEGEIIYMGESSNTSFNPWTDTLSESISDFLQLYLPSKRVTAITHESFHPGLFLKMLKLLPKDDIKRTLVITLNMRTCGPSAIYSGNEASNQQEALFYSKRLPLLTRIYLSLHFYDNRNALELERLKFKYWRTQKINFLNSGSSHSVKEWLDQLALSNRSERWRHVADAYVKEFAFVLDENNPRIKDLDNIVQFCNRKNVRLIYHILPENRDYAQLLFGNKLTSIMDSNVYYLENRYKKMGVEVVNNYMNSSGIQYTDQWYPTEHLNAELRNMIAKSISKLLIQGNRMEATLKLQQNNYPNPEILQPMADTMLREYGVWHFAPK